MDSTPFRLWIVLMIGLAVAGLFQFCQSEPDGFQMLHSGVEP